MTQSMITSGNPLNILKLFLKFFCRSESLTTLLSLNFNKMKFKIEKVFIYASI